MRRKKTRLPSPPPAAVLAVLGDDDLLREILLRLDFPTHLVRAALVSKRWYRHASDPVFLRRFRGLHPPRLLGLYLIRAVPVQAQFVPLPHPAELGSVLRRARFQLGTTGVGTIFECRGGRVLAFLFDNGFGFKYGVCSPLHEGGHLPVVIQPPSTILDCTYGTGSQYWFLPEDGGNGMLYNVLRLVCGGRKVFAQQFVIKAGAAYELRTSASVKPPASWLTSDKLALLAHGKIYMLGRTGYIVGLDLESMSLFFVNLPDEVHQCKDTKNLDLCKAQDSGFYLIHLVDLHIHVWLRGTNGNNAGDWQHVDTISVHQAIGHLAKPTWESTFQSGDVKVYRVEDNASMLLKVERDIFYMNINSRKVEKVFEILPDDDDDNDFHVHPFMMVWPPRFPALSYEQV